MMADFKKLSLPYVAVFVGPLGALLWQSLTFLWHFEILSYSHNQELPTTTLCG